jgi:hypothetical protein
MKYLKLVLFLTIIAIAISFKPTSNKFGKGLKYFLDNSNLNDFTVYVTLSDKGPDALQKLSNPLGLVSQKSLDRRAKVLPPDKLVDFTDIPIYETYVNKVSQNVNKVRHLLKWFNMISVEVNRQQINELVDLDFVQNIEVVESCIKPKDDLEVTVENNSPPMMNPDVDSLSYGLSLVQDTLIKVNYVHNQGIFGQGIIIGHFDAGYLNLNHEAFTTLPMKILKKKDFHTGDTVNIANHSHGQATLSLVGGYKPGQLIGPAFKSSFILCRTEVDPGERWYEMDHWAAAAQWVDSLGADIITSSLGYLTFDPPDSSFTWQNMNGRTLTVSKAAVLAARKGIIVSNSAGNSGNNTSHNTLGGPADADSIITVGATTSTGVKASYSSVGPTTDSPGRIKPDVMTMGSGNQVATQTGYSTSGSGTSWACPMNAGVAALVLCVNRNLTPIQVRNIIRKFANNSANPNNQVGWGLVNARLAVDSARKTDNTPPVIQHTPAFTITPNTGAIGIKSKITDNGIIRQWSTEAPRLYYRKYSGGVWSAYTPVTAYYINKDSMFFSITGSVLGTTVEYYFAAQDIAMPTPLMSTLPAGGSGINPPGTTPPPTRFQFIVTNIITGNGIIPSSYKLYNNYPNPFNPITKIKFDLPENSFVKLRIFDMLGREVSNLISQDLKAGQYEVPLNGENLSSGIYFYKIETLKFSDIKKMMLIK